MDQSEPSPFTRLMGVKIISRTAQRTESELLVREDLCNRHGIMHGGAVMAWGDTLGGMTAVAALAEGQRTATIESKTNFFAPIPKGDAARAVCMPLHSGRTTIVLQTNITRSDGKLAAIVTQTQIVLPATKKPSGRDD
jgi:1,4-dihydroxy-2-naphthoyl-CoA hydrolase